MGVTEAAKIKISNRLGSSAKTFKNLIFKRRQKCIIEKDYSGFLSSNLKKFKNMYRRKLQAGSFFF
jgi:hypothetical protein